MSNISLNLYENGQKLEPLTYSNGKTQTNVVEEILEAFESHDLVYLKGVVGSGKSVIGIRTALEMGGGAISVPTKVLSDQYYDDYYAGDKYFLKPSGDRAKFAVFKGRSNFTCPFLRMKHPGWEGWRLSCQNRQIPCRKPLDSGEGRFDALEECPWAAYVRSIGSVPNKFSSEYQVRMFDAVGGEYAVFMKEHDRKPYRCPYWEQYWEITGSDVLAMNSSKFKAELKIGRLPDVPLAVIDEGDAFLDGLCPEVNLNRVRVERNAELMRKNAKGERGERSSDESKVLVKLEEGSEGFRAWLRERDKRIESLADAADALEETWAAFLKDKIGAETLAERVWGLLGACGWETELRIQLEMVVRRKGDVSVRVDRGGDTEVSYYLPEPEPILKRLLDLHDGKVLFMSATKPSRNVLQSVFGIDPMVVEGETEYPGKIIQKFTKDERKVNYERWRSCGYRARYAKLRDELLSRMERPSFVPVHGVKYLPNRVENQDPTEEPYIEEDGVVYSTKMDRGADLEEMKSVCLLKYPFPSLGDPLLQEMKEHLGENAFWPYYRDIARREFVQQVGRIMRDEDTVKEFWSPDLTCHRELQKQWSGNIVTKEVKM